MGRFYNTNTGRGGKFAFACQKSTDPQDYFDMAETHIIYTAGEDSVNDIKKKLDSIYDNAKVPQKERIYDMTKSDNEQQDFYDRYHKYFFERCSAGEGDFAGENGTEREVFKKAHLAMSRLWMGLTILSDIKEDGYCELEAEL